jgi:putative lipoprotein
MEHTRKDALGLLRKCSRRLLARPSRMAVPVLALVVCAGAWAQNAGFYGTWADKVQTQGKTAYAAMRLETDLTVVLAVVPSEGTTPMVGTGRWRTNGNNLIVTLDYIDGQRQRMAQTFTFVKKGEQLTIAPETQTRFKKALLRLSHISPKPLGLLAGTITYRQKIALSPTAVAVVRLVDLTASGTDLAVVSTKKMDSVGQVPIKFILTYDRSAIDGRHEYAVQGQILEDGKVVFTQDKGSMTPVPDKPVRMQLVLTPAGG